VAAARSTNNLTDSHAAKDAGDVVCSPGSPRGGTGHSCSPDTRRDDRLLTTIRRARLPFNSSTTTWPAARRCSKLSRTMRSFLSRRWAARCSSNVQPRETCSPMDWAMDEGTSPGSLTGASGTKYTPSGKSPATSAARRMQRRVLPLPPVLVSVRRRLLPRSRLASASSCSLPTKLVSGRGRLFGVSSRVRRGAGGTSACPIEAPDIWRPDDILDPPGARSSTEPLSDRAALIPSPGA
jgi:hypothetical protein